MSIIKKPYEISVWDDVWEGDRFVEKRICVIGSNTMESQSRAIHPSFTRNTNGTKKFSFKMYKKYIDNITGEEVDNPFAKYLISERKVKLFYKNEWHDFIIKNIVEDNNTYLSTYQLEDMLVTELSKNGFGIILDEQKTNNIGTANELATKVLKETDWAVGEDSEAFVQTVDEALVYVTLPENTRARHLLDQTDLTRGVEEERDDENQIIEYNLSGKTVLAFYSSCANKPHRFQFIYVADGNYTKDIDRYITNKNCQYYIEYDNPKTAYSTETDNGFYLPNGFNCAIVNEYNKVGSGSILSSKYRGKRYGFAQQSKYIPVLNRYVNLYQVGNVEKYGYEVTKYRSAAIAQNIISNTSFESTSGWTGTYLSGNEKAIIENVYGRFDSKTKTFVNSIDELNNGTFDPAKEYKAYLKITFPAEGSCVINSGPYDNRTLIGNMVVGDKWVLSNTIRDEEGNQVNSLTFNLGEYNYSSSTGGYTSNEDSKLAFSAFEQLDETTNKWMSTVEIGDYTAEEFKKTSVRLCITSDSQQTVYIEDISLFQAVFDENGTFVDMEDQADSLGQRLLEKKYYFVDPGEVAKISNEEQLKPEAITSSLSYERYKPKYNEGAQKVRSVNAKESNYFNILQTIAETFGAWLKLKVVRDDFGGIIQKKVEFKNYAGQNNYAGFKYGVNLKGIQRTYESKNIVTKLIVKQNSNEFAKNGFCTIARAGANPTRENYIYDFQYYHNKDLLNLDDYLQTVYLGENTEGGLNGYFPRIKALNVQIEDKNASLINIAQDLTKYKAELEVASAGLTAAISGIEEIEEDFESLTGVRITNISPAKVKKVTAEGQIYDTEEAAEKGLGVYFNFRPDWLAESDGKIGVTQSSNSDGVKQINYRVQCEEGLPEKTFSGKVFYQAEFESSPSIVRSAKVTFRKPRNHKYANASIGISTIDTTRSDVRRLQKEFAVYSANEKKYQADKKFCEDKVRQTQKEYDTLYQDIQTLTQQKKDLNQLFFSQYSRFIQEGTWINEEYVDDEKYYADAQSVMYNSCYPQVAYSINTLELSGLPGYEFFTFEPGDKTTVEDYDFFEDNHKEEVIITELTENLDDPTNNLIKVQNFKNQFQDLFQKITATVQQAQYSTGSYEKAVALAEANQAKKQQFISDAFAAANARFSAAGQQSVEQGVDGLLIYDTTKPCDAIRMIGGAILLSKQDENGQQKWVTGVTSDGISANLITAGMLNAGEIAIMNAEEPVFRWDAYGISAYDAFWYNDQDIGEGISGVNTKKFVRFDKNGIYGINDVTGIDGAKWHPNNIDDIRKVATFSLNWEGLFLKLGSGTYNQIAVIDGDKYEIKNLKNPINHTTQAILGRTNGVIYNDWQLDPKKEYYNSPIYNVEKASELPTFTKIFAVGDQEDLVIYDDGTLVANNIKLTGSITWTSESSPSKRVFATSSYVHKFQPIEKSLPSFGTRYSDFDANNDNAWHKNSSQNDSYYATTDDYGATWQGPFLISGKAIEDTQVQYAKGNVGLDPSTFTENLWDDAIPTNVSTTECIYQRSRYVFNNKTYSTWEYSISSVSGPAGTDKFNCYIESSIGNFYNSSLSLDTDVTFTARIFQGTTQIDESGNNLVYSWYVNNEQISGENKKQLVIKLKEAKKGNIHFSATEK